MLKKRHNGIAFVGKRAEKPKDFAGTWRRLLCACRHHWLGICVALLFVLASTVLSVLAPLKLADLTDLFAAGLENGIDRTAFLALVRLLLLLYVGGTLLSVLAKWLLSGMTQHVSHALRRSISQKINRLPTSACESAVTGDLFSRVTNDMDVVGHAMHESMAELPAALAMLIGSLAMMLLVSPPLALVALAVTLLGTLGMIWIMHRSQKYFDRQQKDLGDLEAFVEEAYAGIDTVKACNAQSAVRAGFDVLNRRLEQSVFHARFMAGTLSPLMSLVANLGYLLVCVVGAFLVVLGQISFGVVVAFVFYVHLFIHPFAEIANAMQGLQSAAAAGERVFEFLDAEEIAEPREAVALPDRIKGEVTCRAVGFTYPNAESPVLSQISFSAKAGQRIAIVGASGSGKSTLMRLLAGYYLPTEGEVLIDGVSTASLSQRQIHRLFAPVFRNAWVFEASIRQNLIYCAEGVGEEKMLRACRAVGIDRRIRTLPKGYDAIVGQDVFFSEGELQKLEIARALLSDHPMLIFDEATASLDPRAELQILSAVQELARGKTAFLITHRLSTTEQSDLVLFLQEGRLKSVGTHRELWEQNESYRNLLRDRA